MLNCAFVLQLRNGFQVNVFRDTALLYFRLSSKAQLVNRPFLIIENMTQVTILPEGGNFREISLFKRIIKDVLLFVSELDK